MTSSALRGLSVPLLVLVVVVTLDVMSAQTLTTVTTVTSPGPSGTVTSAGPQNLTSTQPGLTSVHQELTSAAVNVTRMTKKLGRPCGQCLPRNSLCVEGFCRCSPGYKARTRRRCVPKVLGDECSKEECSLVIAHSMCDLLGNSTTGNCSCTRDHIKSGRKSCRPKTLNDPCQEVSECNFPSSQCVKETCHCAPGLKPNAGGSNQDALCVPRVLGDTCQENWDCPGNNTVCGPENVCSCGPGFEPLHEQCVRVRLRRTSCKNHRECETWFQHARCQIGSRAGPVCDCEDKHVENRDRTRCEFVHLQSQCRHDRRCQVSVSDSACVNMTCQCEAGHRASQDLRQCHPLHLGVNMTCQADQDCRVLAPRSECQGGLCGCQQGFKVVDLQCLRRTLGDACDTNGDCTAVDTRWVCAGKSRTCACATGSVMSPDGRTCVPRRVRVHSCDTDTQCSADIAHSHCPQCEDVTSCRRACQCQEGFTESSNGSLCRKVALRDMCLTDSECGSGVKGSICVNGQCRCQFDHRVTDGGCRAVMENDTCTSNAHCGNSSSQLICSRQGACVCRSGFTFRQDTCQKLKLGDACPWKGCSGIPFSVCDSIYSRCMCRKGYLPDQNNTACQPRTIGSPCTDTVDCSRTISGQALCEEGACQCGPGQRAVGVRGCVRRSLGDQCQGHDDCTPALPYSQCQDGACSCLGGYYFRKEEHDCRKRELGNLCVDSQDCAPVIQHSVCQLNVCHCGPGFEPHPDNVTSVCTPTPSQIGQSCVSDIQCERVDPVSMCTQACTGKACSQECTCPSDTFVNKTKDTCVPMPSRVSDPCTSDVQCESAIPFSQCHPSQSKCRCDRYHFPGNNGSRCYPFGREVGAYCEESLHCRGRGRGWRDHDKMRCGDNNTCECVFSHHLVHRFCRERPRIPLYHPSPCNVSCEKECVNWTQAACDDSNNHTFPKEHRCEHRHASLSNSSNSTQCVPVQTYLLTLNIAAKADRYEYSSLAYTKNYSSPHHLCFQCMATRIRTGVSELMAKTSTLSSRYVASEVKAMTPLGSQGGLQVRLLLNLTARYMNTTSLDVLQSEIQAALRGPGLKYGPELGESRLRLSQVDGAVEVTDKNECQDLNHNCHENATCLNTLGSFVCYCKVWYDDFSSQSGQEPGRDCRPRQEILLNDDSCSSVDCSTTWEFVALAVTLFLVILFAFIVYEIIQRKQTFTARYKQLYAKLGTTKIRRLRRASMAKIQDVRKLQQELRTKHGKKGRRKGGLGVAGDLLGTLSEEAEETDEGKRKEGKKKKRKKKKKSKKDSDQPSDVTGPVEESGSTEDPPVSGVNIVHPPAMPDTPEPWN